MENITTLACRNISGVFGYTYVLFPYMLSVLHLDKDCEQTWYDEAMTLLSDGHQFWNQTGLVVGVTSEKITLSKCIKLYCNVTCDGSGQKLRHIYQVTNDSSSQEDVDWQKHATSDATAIGVPIVLLILVLIGVLCCGINRRRIREVWQRSMSERSNKIKLGNTPNETDSVKDIEVGHTETGETDPMNPANTKSEEPGDVVENGCVNDGAMNGEACTLQDEVNACDEH
ncbi:uncharacterized protein Hap1MRO34_002445 [Clarias gariepinus]|uniref:uncharacterized protein LOC128516048 n=1 Tax=Clarias gariepinus TaxID=13013 RepID=UPI00234D7951|nr:uncharacterized protein LOC128516048 [Clarias gariepinus]